MQGALVLVLRPEHVVASLHTRRVLGNRQIHAVGGGEGVDVCLICIKAEIDSTGAQLGCKFLIILICKTQAVGVVGDGVDLVARCLAGDGGVHEALAHRC